MSTMSTHLVRKKALLPCQTSELSLCLLKLRLRENSAVGLISLTQEDYVNFQTENFTQETRIITERKKSS